MSAGDSTLVQENAPTLLVPCDGCGISFPIRQAEGDCPKCIKLVSFTIDSTDYIQLQVSLEEHQSPSKVYELRTIRNGLSASSVGLLDVTWHLHHQD